MRESDDPTGEVIRRIEAAGDLSETVVRLQIVLDEAQEARLVDRDVKLALKDAYDVAAIQRDVQRQARDRLGGVSVEALTPVQMLDRYLDTRKVEEARKKLLLQYAEDLIREADTRGRLARYWMGRRVGLRAEEDAVANRWWGSTAATW